MEQENNTLYIPMGVKTENEFFSGFGKKELLQSMVGTVIGVALSLLVWVISQNVAFTMIGVLSGIAGSIMMTTKDQNNMSVVTQVSNMVRFAKSQKHYPYIYGSEWGEEIH